MNPTDTIQLTSWKPHSLLPLFQALTPRLLQVEAALTGLLSWNAEDVLALVELMRERVAEQHGIFLHLEGQIIS